MTRHQVRLGVIASACYWAVLLGALSGSAQQYVTNWLYWLVAHILAMLLGFTVLALGLTPQRSYWTLGERQPDDSITYDCDIFEETK